MRKVAILFAGMPRFYDKCYEGILDYFSAKDWQLDYFIHSWTNCWLDKYKQKENLVLNHDPNFIEDELSKIYNPKVIEVEDQLKCEKILESFELFKKSVNFTDIRYQGKFARNNWRNKISTNNLNHFLNQINAGQLYSISRASQLRKKYEEENNFKYDLIIRFRLDNLLKPNQNVEPYLNFVDKTIRDPHNPYPHNPVNCDGVLVAVWMMMKQNQLHVGDKFFAGSSEVFNLLDDLLGFQMTRILEYNSTKNMKDQKHFFSCPEAVIGSVVQRSDILCVTGLNIHLINYREPFLELKNQTWDNLYHHWNKLKLYL